MSFPLHFHRVMSRVAQVNYSLESAHSGDRCMVGLRSRDGRRCGSSCVERLLLAVCSQGHVGLQYAHRLVSPTTWFEVQTGSCHNPLFVGRSSTSSRSRGLAEVDFSLFEVTSFICTAKTKVAYTSANRGFRSPLFQLVHVV